MAANSLTLLPLRGEISVLPLEFDKLVTALTNKNMGKVMLGDF